MAQSVSQIQQFVINTLVTAGAAVGVVIPTDWSNYDYRQLFTYVVAVAENVQQQLMDAYRVDLSALIASAAPQTGAWMQNNMLLFQFSATNPQIVAITPPSFAPTYPTIDTSLQVIKYCSVTSGVFGTTVIKIACQQDGAPIDTDSIDTGILPAAQSYVNTLDVTGIVYNVVSLKPDRLYQQLNVWYKGQYSSIIQDSVISAIQSYLGGIPFDGKIVLSDLEAAIKAVAGVNDIAFVNVQGRAYTTTVLEGTDLVLNSTEIQRNFATIAGYIIPEDTSGYTLTDLRTDGSGLYNLNLIAE